MWVIIALLSLAVLVILILCVPLDLAFQLNTHGHPKFSVRLLWLFGLVDKDLNLKKGKPEKKTDKGKQKSKDRVSVNTLYQILRTKGFLSQTAHLLKSIFRCLKINELTANFKIGLENPPKNFLTY